jgi:ABC-type uncharacterized transport system permease subunit
MAQDKTLGIQTIGAWLSIISAALSAVASVYYAIAANAAGNFSVIVLLCFACAAVCAAAYVFVPGEYSDVLNLISVVLLAAGICNFAVSSIATLADVLSGITMFGSSGGIGYIIAVLVMAVVALVLEQVSCFMHRSK